MYPLRADGAPVVVVGVQVSVSGSYRPPSFSFGPSLSLPSQTIIFEPVQTAVNSARAVGAPVVVVGVQMPVTGSYWPPVFV